MPWTVPWNARPPTASIEMRTRPACSLEPSNAVAIHGANVRPSTTTASAQAAIAESAVETVRRTAAASPRATAAPIAWVTGTPSPRPVKVPSHVWPATTWPSTPNPDGSKWSASHLLRAMPPSAPTAEAAAVSHRRRARPFHSARRDAGMPAQSPRARGAVSKTRCARFRALFLRADSNPSGPLVSVLLATRNGERYLEEALAGLAAQTWPPVEIASPGTMSR